MTRVRTIALQGVAGLLTDRLDSIINAVNIAAANAKTYYLGDQPGQTPGLLVGPYYW